LSFALDAHFGIRGSWPLRVLVGRVCGRYVM
jgi:hypothetical protein